MLNLTGRLRQEHKALRERMEPLRQLLYDAPDQAPAAQEQALRAVVQWVREDVLPHAEREERKLYPLVDRLMGGRESATATMVMDDDRIRELAQQLEDLLEASEEQREQRWDWVKMVAAQLEMLLSLHLEKEEAVYLAVLERHATPEDIEALHEGGDTHV